VLNCDVSFTWVRKGGKWPALMAGGLFRAQKEKKNEPGSKLRMCLLLLCGHRTRRGEEKKGRRSMCVLSSPEGERKKKLRSPRLS